MSACTCGIRDDVPAGPHHGAGCPMEVSAETIRVLRAQLSGETGTIRARQVGLFEAIRRYEDQVSAATGWSCVSAKAYEGEFLRWVEQISNALGHERDNSTTRIEA